MSLGQFKKFLAERGFQRAGAELTASMDKKDAPVGAYYMPLVAESKAVSDADLRKRIHVIMTTPKVDRMGDVVVPTGVKMHFYQKNPVVLFAHDYTMPPVGIVDAKTINVHDGGIDADVLWDAGAAGQEIAGLYERGTMKAWSIGFLPQKWDLIEDPKTKLVTGFKITEWELLELSAVPVPANPEALSRDLAEIEGRSADEMVLACCKTLRAALGAGEPPKQPDEPPNAAEAPSTTTEDTETETITVEVDAPVAKAPEDARFAAIEAKLAEFEKHIKELNVEAVKAMPERIAALEAADVALAKAEERRAADQRRREQEEALNRAVAKIVDKAVSSVPDLVEKALNRIKGAVE